jgi:putative ABC transport system permease protein
MAMGAKALDILKLVLGRALVLAAAGAAIGLGAAFALTRLLTSLLFVVKATDLFTFSAVPLTLVVIAMFASYIPARRATKVNPLVALRYE